MSSLNDNEDYDYDKDHDADAWKASSIGIKCISYKPVGYMFLTRRILDMYVTDGKHKLDVLYSYSKKFRNKVKIPSIGTSIKNCTFCDTITLDFDPESTMFDLVMEVQIITQGATRERNNNKNKKSLKKKMNKLSITSNSTFSEINLNNHNDLKAIIVKKNESSSSSPSSSEESSSNCNSSGSEESDEDNPMFISSYDVKIHDNDSENNNNNKGGFKALMENTKSTLLINNQPIENTYSKNLD
jgi:hypothetical protein